MDFRVQTDKEVLTIKNGCHVLAGFSTATFVTDKVSAFYDYIKTLPQAVLNDGFLTYSNERIEVWPNFPEKSNDYNYNALAVCNISKSPELTLLSENINNRLKEEALVKLLWKLNGPNNNFIGLIDSIENMSVNKIVSMSKSKDSRGNCSYEYHVKDHGAATFAPPQTIKITIPVISHIDNKAVVFEPRFVFSYHMVGSDVDKRAALEYTLEMINFETFVSQSVSKIVESILKEIDIKKFWGKLSLERLTDEWKYKDVPIMFKGV